MKKIILSMLAVALLITVNIQAEQTSKTSKKVLVEKAVIQNTSIAKKLRQEKIDKKIESLKEYANYYNFPKDQTDSTLKWIIELNETLGKTTDYQEYIIFPSITKLKELTEEDTDKEALTFAEKLVSSEDLLSYLENLPEIDIEELSENGMQLKNLKATKSYVLFDNGSIIYHIDKDDKEIELWAKHNIALW
ncbi:MAG: hypothetical protein HOF38_04630 [Elusimicrobiaceae bacterium]|jgi:hypothetical protein|nr:hypothetical protein [Elusimicrobiaceae bacterium]MBT3955422.1 hypothetical protein [Elusimicrobiaceae bacterium]MBT4007699.1 hypothetical protein [Elusimicrobiaceae bacterium]MBT4402445.1 hypothetical protein [Elusimicrobiaceae bacterium]MBT4439845.1 hypothetical protein [Elusimicrobiaceae bacterium]